MWFVIMIIVIGFGLCVLDRFYSKNEERIKQEKEIKEREEQKQKEIKEREEEKKKLYEKEAIPNLKFLISDDEKQLNEILKEYKDLIESDETMNRMLCTIKESINEANTALSLIDIEKIDEIIEKRCNFKYYINSFEKLCMETNFSNNIEKLSKDFDENVNLIEIKERKLDKEELIKYMQDASHTGSKIKNYLGEYFKQLEELEIRKRIYVAISLSNFSYDEYSNLYADLSVGNSSLSFLKQVKILVKIYQNETVVGNAFSQQILMLKPGEEFNKRINLLTDAGKGNKFILVNYKFEY